MQTLEVKGFIKIHIILMEAKMHKVLRPVFKDNCHELSINSGLDLWANTLNISELLHRIIYFCKVVMISDIELNIHIYKLDIFYF